MAGAQQASYNWTFHVVTEDRTYELLADDEVAMKRYIKSIHITLKLE